MRNLLLTGISALLLVLAITGCGSGREGPPAVVRSAPYRAYLEENAASLVRAIQAMLPELEHGEVSRAQSRFVRARVRYSQIEPAAKAFPQLNARIDGLPRQVTESRLTGFHRIERELWEAEDAAGMTAVARRLLADTKQLQEDLVSADFSAQELAGGARRILSEISTVKLTNKEDVYSGADLVEVSGNLEAVGAAFGALRPILTESERARLRTLLHRAYAKVAEYGTPARDPDQPRDLSPGAIFIVFDELSPDEVEQLDRPIRALGGAFSEVDTRLQEVD